MAGASWRSSRNDNSVVDRLIEIDPDSGDPLFIDAPGTRAWTQQRLAP